MDVPSLSRLSSQGVSFLGDARRPGGVALAFTERAGGVSSGPWASLNLGDSCGDSPEHVRENRRRALAAIGAQDCAERLVAPRQVHGDDIVTIRSCGDEALEDARLRAREGADAVVCVAPRVPVLLCFADCLPVVLVGQGGFAIAHSGWKGTMRRVAAQAATALAHELGCGCSELVAYIGPHVTGQDYEVSDDLLGRFAREFGDGVRAGGRRLDLAEAVRVALEGVGVTRERVCDAGVSTASSPERFFSYRAQNGCCGRQGALAMIDAQVEGGVVA
ncbi:polyphenol oxidase family protein [Olsenella sp. HMSC062G07]|uniref:polyphenol oxidase family protein n=1 Tax=Olsenella sp. HMSC062G07 TaxID=1739330 RepID=UPI0008A184AE|nr:polyphenol oxidase family protein [Olsenella sp. HMSC062G07]OFK24877.1 multicopper polyphenol oxidase [Olsenella sp. HMSC062G07]